jgi:hypothetical protein
LPQSAKLYRKTQQPDGEDTLWCRSTATTKRWAAFSTLYSTGSSARTTAACPLMMDVLRAAVEFHVRDNKPVRSAACAAAGYDQARLSASNDGACSSELHVDADVVTLEDARLSNDIAELRLDTTKAKKEAEAQDALIDEITRLVEGRFPARASTSGSSVPTMSIEALTRSASKRSPASATVRISVLQSVERDASHKRSALKAEAAARETVHRCAD